MKTRLASSENGYARPNKVKYPNELGGKLAAAYANRSTAMAAKFKTSKNQYFFGLLEVAAACCGMIQN